MTFEIYIAYIVACFVIALVPGPTVTVIVANSLAHGSRAGLLNVAGTQLGLALMMAILVVGLSSVIAAMGWLFDWLRWAGAAYLVWLGWKLLRAPEAMVDIQKSSVPKGGFLLQGFLVLMATPKRCFVRRFHPAVHRPDRQLRRPDRSSRCHRDGSRAGVRRCICCRDRTRQRHALQKTCAPGPRLSGGFLIGGGIWFALDARPLARDGKGSFCYSSTAT